MANRNAETMDDETITRGTGNVFADLGYADADERQTKLRLAHAINGVVGRRRLTQAATAAKLHINQPKVSALANYKLDGFSVEFPDWWFNVRSSNTEPLIRLNLEAKTQAQMAQKRDEILALIRG